MSTALISVYNKQDILNFARSLKELKWDIISTGGTCMQLQDAGIETITVSEFTGSSEVLGGRVKTLHPKIFSGILARNDQQEELDELGIPRIDLVCCNLYPFRETVKKTQDHMEILENIDIGGVSLVRAAAKNYLNVIAVTDPDDYVEVILGLSLEGISDQDRKKYALKAYRMTSEYEKAIYSYFSSGTIVDGININMLKSMDLRYGENSHQSAALYGSVPFEKIQGEKELSFNNIQDANSAMNVVKSLQMPSAAIIKHCVPCGGASAQDIKSAYTKALASDSMSAFGGIVGLNGKVDENMAAELIKVYFEVIIAPDFSWEALNILKEKPNLRVVRYFSFEEETDMRNVSGGLLIQTPDTFDGEEWQTATKAVPDSAVMDDLAFAWKIARFLKSNAVVIAKDFQTLGLGSGQTSRVGAVDVAVSKLKQFFPGADKDLVMASDAFFPFPDAVQEAANAGVRAIVQPGGSRNDQNVIKMANELGVSMVFAGRRHFLH